MENYLYSLQSLYKDECVALFLRGDADILICNEEKDTSSIPVSFLHKKLVLGQEPLIPVVSSQWLKKNPVEDKQKQPIPVIAYPKTSYLQKMVEHRSEPKNTVSYPFEIICETALSASVKEMALAELGLGWLPKSFVQKELVEGQLVNMQGIFGFCLMELVLYASKSSMKSHVAEVVNVFAHMNFERQS